MSDSTVVRFPTLPLKKEGKSNALEVTPAQNQPEQLDDETLIYRMRNGDRDACSCLFKRFAQTVRNVGRRIIRNNTEADDLVQEVFLYIHRKSALFDSSKGSARSWIIQVAYTQALLRRRELKSHGFYQVGIANRRIEGEQDLGGFNRRSTGDIPVALFSGLHICRDCRGAGSVLCKR
jgi:hypothetical protein